MAPLRTSMRSIAEPSAIIVGSTFTSTNTIQRTSATCLSEPGKSRGTQARKKACEYCYRVHKRCAGTFPCDRCIKAGCAAECTEHKRQRHNGRPRRGGVPASAAAISALRSPTEETKDDEAHSSIPIELDALQTLAVIPSPPALPFPSPGTVPAVLCDPRSALVGPHVPHVDTISSPSLTDSSGTTDENTNPVESLFDACLAGLVSEQRRNDTEAWAWDALEQQHGSPAISQMLFDDPELWEWFGSLISPSTVRGLEPASGPGSPGNFLT